MPRNTARLSSHRKQGGYLTHNTRRERQTDVATELESTLSGWKVALATYPFKIALFRVAFQISFEL